VISKKIDKYISTRYQNWLEYAEYQSKISGLADEGNDLLNEVLLDLLKKPEEKIEELFEQNKDGHKGLDYFILRAIKTNATSKTAPYRWKYHKMKTDDNTDPANKEENEDEILDPDDHYFNEQKEEQSEYLCRRYELTRQILEELDLPENEKEIFRWKVFYYKPMSCWREKDNVWRIYNKVKALIIDKKTRKANAYKAIISREKKRANRIKLEYKATEFPWMYKVSPRYNRAVKCIQESTEKLEWITKE